MKLQSHKLYSFNQLYTAYFNVDTGFLEYELLGYDNITKETRIYTLKSNIIDLINKIVSSYGTNQQVGIYNIQGALLDFRTVASKRKGE